MNLFYNDQAAGLTTQQQFNGNISAIKWSNSAGLNLEFPSAGTSLNTIL